MIQSEDKAEIEDLKLEIAEYSSDIKEWEDGARVELDNFAKNPSRAEKTRILNRLNTNFDRRCDLAKMRKVAQARLDKLMAKATRGRKKT